MNNRLYFKLAWSNLKKNKNTFFPFGLSCGVMIAMFYMLLSISGQISKEMFFGAGTMKSILTIGVWLCGIFSAMVIFYTNMFLIKRRTKELGLYSILGMEKKHIRKVLFWEVCFVMGCSILCGLAAGILFSRLMFLVLLNILNLKTSFRFTISLAAMEVTALLFAGISAVIILYNQIKLSRLKPIDLLHQAKAGEREPGANWFLAVLGFVCLGIGYYIAVSVKNPIRAIDSFFFAVLLIIIGTYSLFISGSIAILKFLKKQKNFYYQKKHFITVSSMMYRMKQNAAGLASICILSTAVLIVLSSTVSLYLGFEDVMRSRHPKDVSASALYMPDEDADGEKYVYDMSLFEKTVNETCRQYGVERTDTEEYYSLYCLAGYDKGNFYMPDDMGTAAFMLMEARTLEDFNRIMKMDYSLQKGEVLVFFNHVDEKGHIDTIKIGNFSAKIANEDRENDLISFEDIPGVESMFLIVPDLETLLELSSAYTEFADQDKEGIEHPIAYQYEFNLEGNIEQKIAFCESLSNALNDAGIPHVAGVSDIFTERQEILGTYGSLFFIGIFMGTLFLLTTVLIIYYKQISEGYDDRERFIVLQKVGMSKKEVKKVIHSQILSIFFLPILLAVIHIAFAFPILRKMLYLLDLNNVSLFIGCMAGTILIFFLIYGVVYGATARVYYKLVNE